MAQVYDAGGGPGHRGLNFEAISTSQDAMYRRTIGNLSDLMQRNAEQEYRQLTISEQLVKLTVLVCREDLPIVRGYIDIEFYPTAAQQVWEKFLSDICKLLKIEFVHSILERGDKACVHRILRLKHGGEYLVRQRENSAILEVLNNGTPPMDNSWDITNRIVDAKNELAASIRNLPLVHTRVRHLVTQALTSDLEKRTAQHIISCKQPIDIVSTISMIYLDNPEDVTPEELSLLALSTRFGDVSRFEGKIDIVSLHRLCLETLNRLAINDDPVKVVNQSMQYVFKVGDQMVYEVDIIVVALRLLSDVMSSLASYRDPCIKLMYKAMRFYAPPAPAHRTREASQQSTSGRPNPSAPSYSVTSVRSYSLNPVSSSSSLGMGRGRARIALTELTRYDNQYATTSERSRYQIQSQQVSGFVKTLEFDSNMRLLSASKRNEESKSATSKPEGVEVTESDAPIKQPILIRGRVRHERQPTAEDTRDFKEDERLVSTGLLQYPHGAPAESGIPLKSRDLPPAVNGQTTSTFRPSELVDSILPPIAESPVEVSLSKPTFRIRDRRKDADVATCADSGRLAWKGSKGELGRVAVEKRAMAEIRGSAESYASTALMFSQEPSAPAAEAALTPGASVSASSAPGGDGLRLPVVPFAALPNMVPSSSGAPTMNVAALKPSVAQPLPTPTPEAVPVTSWIPAMQGKKAKKTLVLEKLPDVSCGVFRGFEGQMKSNVVLTQAFATLLKMMTISFANRDFGFKQNAVEFSADIALVCPAMPRILEYFVELVNAMFADGFGDPADDLASQPVTVDDPTMVGTMTTNSESLEGAEAGRVLDAMSELSLPSYDPEGAPPDKPVRLPDLPDEVADVLAGSIHTNDAVLPDDRKNEELSAGERDEKAENEKNRAEEAELTRQLLDERYRRTPSDRIVMALSMCASHIEVRERERSAAAAWLETWNNNTREFKMAVLKGKNLCGL